MHCSTCRIKKHPKNQYKLYLGILYLSKRKSLFLNYIRIRLEKCISEITVYT